MINLRRLECFIAAAEQGSMTRAAERLGVTQSAISLAVAALEDEFGAQLLIRRRSRPLALTHAGKQLLPAARELLAHAEEVHDSVRAHGGALRGPLTVGCFRTTAPFLLPGLLESFQARHPSVALSFIEGPLPELVAALREGRCELALAYDVELVPGIEYESLYARRPYVLLSPAHPLAAEWPEEIPLAALGAHELVLLDVPPSSTYLLGVLAQGDVTPTIRYRVSSLELLRSLVARNLGYGLLISRPPHDDSYERRPLTTRRLAESVTPTHFSIAWVAGVRRTRRARAFAAHCREMLAGGQRATG